MIIIYRFRIVAYSFFRYISTVQNTVINIRKVIILLFIIESYNHYYSDVY